MTGVLRRFGPRVLPPVLLALAAWILWRELQHLSLAQVAAEFADWGYVRLGAAFVLIALSYGLLAAMEWFGLRWAGAKVPFKDVLLGSFCANAFAHSIGFAVLVGSAIRVRFYARHGASLVMVAQTSVFCAVSFGLGIVVLAGMAFLVAPTTSIGGYDPTATVGRLIGLLLLAGPAAYVAACAFLRGRVTIAGHGFSLPPARTAWFQIALGLVDNAVTAAVVWVLLPGGGVTFPAFAGAYSAATLTGVVSSVPGGAGVFEGAMLALLPDVSRAAMAAAFIGYRLFYYLIPLAIALAILSRTTTVQDRLLVKFKTIWRSAAPPALSLATFALGAVLILTSVGRIEPDRLAVLRATLPIAVVETSHLLSLVSGLALMAASYGLLRRRAVSVSVAVAAALIGASTALLRGLDVGPAILTATLAVCLLLSRKAFRRRGVLRADQLATWWLSGMVAVLLGAVALGLWVYDDTPYETRLWAQVGYHADPARFLRGVAVLGAGLLTLGAWMLARTGGPSAEPSGRAVLEALRPLVENEPDTTARLALTGDKAILRSEGGEAFIMYGAAGRSLIAMGDPVGDPEAGRELLWRFKELADASDARMVMYHASPKWITDYLDLGLSLLKLGEEARVFLPEFGLEGAQRKGLRYSHAKAQRDGMTFEIVMPPIGDGLMAELELISDAWLLEHGGREKGFSLGRFDPQVIRHDPMALVRMEGKVVAFANICTGGKVEASIDLMRHGADAPRGVMDFLFVELLLWAKGQGYQWFNLGMAPLSGFADHPLAPTWHKIGAQVARRGGRFYGFTGLRAFKEKFDPVWTPRYLAASPTGLASAMVDAARLVARAPPIRPTNR